MSADDTVQMPRIVLPEELEPEPEEADQNTTVHVRRPARPKAPAEAPADAPADVPAEAPGQVSAEVSGQVSAEVSGEVDDSTTMYVRRPTPKPTPPPSSPTPPASKPVPPPSSPTPPPSEPVPPPSKPAPPRPAPPARRPSTPVPPAPREAKAASETVTVPRVAGPRMPAIPPPPPKRGFSEIPFRVVYMVGAIIATVLALVLIFVIFGGDTPERSVRRASGTPALAGGGPGAEVTLPPVPATKVFPAYAGKAAVVIGLVADTETGIVYPRLGVPWKAKSYAPFTVAQRIGKVARPYTMIVSAKYPITAPKTKPAEETGYRELAVRAARWSLRSQFPAGATLTWTGSQPLATGTGWLLGYRVAHGSTFSEALVAVVEVGKRKPAMLLATVPDTRKAQWRDLATLVKGVRPL
ncbi:hypothetical protein [Nonomuraea typhae]|uniref:Uncharacterized protein n=1 Tax=Nonomuraea typhae TaxID=2603600 RepID=A0ABW7Z0I7_9ACTN